MSLTKEEKKQIKNFYKKMIKESSTVPDEDARILIHSIDGDFDWRSDFCIWGLPCLTSKEDD